MAGFYDDDAFSETEGSSQPCLTPTLPDFDVLWVNNAGERRSCQTSIPTTGSKDFPWSQGKREETRGKRSGYRSSDLGDSDDMLHLRRERNKIAANKCRQKKKEHAEKIRKEFERLQGRHSSLESLIEELRRERQTLFHMLETHRPMCRRPTDGAAASLFTHAL